MTLFKLLEKMEPVAFGGFSELYVYNGNAVKLIEDQDYLGTLEESYKQNLAAEAGLAPKVHAVAKQDNQVIVIMDKIDDTKWFHPETTDDIAPTLLGELPIAQAAIGLTLYAKMLKAGVVHADFHSGNWFLNDKGEAIAIDFGLSSELHEAPMKYLKRAIQNIIPTVENLGLDWIAEALVAAWHTEERVTIIDALQTAADEIIDEDY